MKTLIVSGFPCVGKSFLVNNYKDLLILDSDSSNFSWESEGVRNKDFPNNYIQHIKDNVGKADIILVSSHIDVRYALVNEGIDFIVAYPNRDCKDDWLRRCKVRNSPESFIKMLDENWEDWIGEMEEFIIEYELYSLELEENEYLSDNIKWLIWTKDLYKYDKKIAKQIKNIVKLLSKSTGVKIDNLDEVETYTYDAIREYCSNKIYYVSEIEKALMERVAYLEKLLLNNNITII